MRNPRPWFVVCGGVLVLLSAAVPRLALAAEAKPTIKEVMTAAHKKPGELLKKVATGKATDAEKAQLVKLYQAMASQRPARGEAASWEEKTAAMVKAAQAAAENKPEAGAELTRVTNCAACHEAHK